MHIALLPYSALITTPLHVAPGAPFSMTSPGIYKGSLRSTDTWNTRRNYEGCTGERDCSASLKLLVQGSLS